MEKLSMRKRGRLLTALSAILFLESGLLGVGAVVLVVALLTTRPDSVASAIALIVLVVVLAGGLALVALNTLRARPWIRGAALTWQLLQIAIAAASFGGLVPCPDIAWLLLIPAVAVIVLLFTKPVMAVTTREPR
jgi:uncharacterized membrane-anchored protein